MHVYVWFRKESKQVLEKHNNERKSHMQGK
jgi:hypothetical protein